MSASGVDKSKLEAVGRDFLMVKDFDDERGIIVLSVPPASSAACPSARSTRMIYQAHPEVDAILHVHAWMEGIRHGRELPVRHAGLAVAVADLVAAEPDPAHAVIGLPEPRHHLHRREPRGDPRPGGAEGAPPGPYDLSLSSVRAASAGATTRSFAMHHQQIASITNSCTTTR